MYSLVQLMTIIQPLLTLLNTTVETTLDSAFTNTTQNATVSDAPLRIPTDFSSLMAFIYSTYAFRDYLKLIVLGGALETLRRFYSASYSNLVDRFFITATFDSEDIASSARLFPSRLIHPTDSGFRLDDVLAFFSSSVASIPRRLS